VKPVLPAIIRTGSGILAICQGVHLPGEVVLKRYAGSKEVPEKIATLTEAGLLPDNGITPGQVLPAEGMNSLTAVNRRAPGNGRLERLRKEIP